MADTIVNTPGRDGTTDNVVGWVIAAAIALALLIGVVALFRNSSVTPTMPTANTQVNIPNTGSTPADASGGTSGSATGTTDGVGTGTGTGSTDGY